MCNQDKEAFAVAQEIVDEYYGSRIKVVRIEPLPNLSVRLTFGNGDTVTISGLLATKITKKFKI